MIVEYSASSNTLFITFVGQAIITVTLPSLTIQTLPTSPDIPTETLDHLLRDHVMPRIIAHKGNLVLHSGGVLINGRAVAISADTGRGKSTLTASLHAADNQILGDDALIVTADDTDIGHHVRAVYPSLRLLPDSVAHLFGENAETRIMAHYSAKRHVAVDGLDATVPLGMLLFLAPPAPEISMRRMTVAETCMKLIANSFALDPTDKDWSVANMRRASALAAAVPAYALTYPRDYGALPDIHAAILSTLDAINTTS